MALNELYICMLPKCLLNMNTDNEYLGFNLLVYSKISLLSYET